MREPFSAARRQLAPSSEERPMSRSLSSLGLVLALLAPALVALSGEESKPVQKPARANTVGSILPTVLEWNSGKYARPPAQFHKVDAGRQRQIKTTVLSRRDGFTISFPHKGPIPTPTVYRGKVYVGGDIESCEFYCFDAST